MACFGDEFMDRGRSLIEARRYRPFWTYSVFNGTDCNSRGFSEKGVLFLVFYLSSVSRGSVKRSDYWPDLCIGESSPSKVCDGKLSELV